MKMRHGERGSALMLTVIVVIILVGISGAMLSETMFRSTTQHASLASEETQLICDAALERARRSLLVYRNANQDAWGEILQYNWTKEEDLSGTVQPLVGVGQTVKDPITGEVSELPSAALTWALTNTDRIMTEYKQAQSSYNMEVNTIVPTNSEDLFCKVIPFGRGAYHIVMADNEDPHGNGVDDDQDGDNWDPDDLAGTEAAANNIDPLIDGDRQVFLVVTAILPNGTMRQNLVLVQFPPRFYIPGAAILTDGSIQMAGAFDIQGTQGIVMANENISGNGGNTASVSVSVNAAGSAAGLTMNNPPPGGINSGVTPAEIPTVDIPFYKTTEFELYENVIILGADGVMRDVKGNKIISTDFSAKIASDGTATWTLSGKNTVPPAIYYVEGNFTMTGQGNSEPYQMTIIAEGNISLGGNSAFKPFELDGVSTNTLALAGKDVRLAGTGNSGAEFQYEGVMIANEQVSAKGNYQLNGSLVGVNSTDSPGSLISNSSAIEPDIVLGGTPSITYNGMATFVPPPAASVSVQSVRRTK